MFGKTIIGIAQNLTHRSNLAGGGGGYFCSANQRD
jgi:hypothetical protein